MNRILASAALSLLFVLIHSCWVSARPASPEEVLYLPWGDNSPTHVRYQTDPDCRYGPQSFHVEAGGSIVSILDPLNQTVNFYQNGSMIKHFHAPLQSKDYVVESENEFVYLINNQLIRFQNESPVVQLTPPNTLPLIQRVYSDAGQLTVMHHDGTVSHPSEKGIKEMAIQGLVVNSLHYQARKQSSTLAELSILDQQGRQSAVISLPVPAGNLGCVRVIGADGANRIFLDVDLIEQTAPLIVQREIWIISDTGEILGDIRIPTHYYTRMFRDLELHQDGTLYHMISSEDGIHIFKWTFPEEMSSLKGEYPQKYQAVLHYNYLVTGDLPETQRIPSGTAQLVTRSEAASIGDNYVQHVWTCTEANISDGVEYTLDGDSVLTPDWIQVGTNQKIPYKWGGTDQLTEYDNGMTAGDYAGDIHLESSSSYARGVDCSGFVCRCWKSPSDYSTYMMVDPAYGPITLPYSSWDEIRTGDAVHKLGHVRMAVGTLQSGAILVVESAGSNTGWRVDYNSYTLSELTNYSPRYYIHMEGAPVQTTIISAGSGSWTVGSTWVGGSVPDTSDHVEIQSGHTISVDNNNAVCKDLSFAADDALIDMNANSMLTVFGNFTLHSTSHTAFSAGWSATNAYIKFAGAAVQTLSGWNAAGGSTAFRDVIIDKDGGKVTTEGTNMRLGIQNSLEIVNGIFELAVQDDIEGRWASSGNFTGNNLPNVIVQSGGKFTMLDGDGAHHMRSDYDAGVHVPIGKFTVYGEAQFRDASSYGINLTGVDIEDGGKVITSTGMGVGEFQCDTLTIKSGGELENYTTADCWGTSAVVYLNEGGLYDTKTATTIFPSVFYNNGTIRYSRESGSDQTIMDMDYVRLEISFDDSGFNKIWALGGNRVVSDELEVNNSANFLITAAAAQSLTVNGTLRMTSGTIDNSDANVSLTVANEASIVRATGTIATAPVFAGVADVRYTSSVASVTTGPELPVAPGVLRDLTIWSTDQTVTLGANAQVNRELTLSNGIFDSDGAGGGVTLTLANGVDIRRGSGSLTAAPIFLGTVDVDYISTLTSVTTGPELPAAVGVLNDLTVSGDQGVTLGADVTVDGACTISGSDLTTGSYIVTLGSAATLSETDSITVLGNVTATRPVSMAVNETFGGIGVEIDAAGGAPGNTTVLRVTGQAKSINGTDGIERYFEITPANNTGLDATVVQHYDHSELNGTAEANLTSYATHDGGVSWRRYNGTVDEPGNTVTITAIDSLSTLTLATSSVTAAGDEDGMPEMTRLVSIYPNPFNPTTKVVFDLQNRANVNISIFDVQGRKVYTLKDGVMPAGRYDLTWQGVDGSGHAVASGIYFCRMAAGSIIQTQKMVLLK